MGKTAILAVRIIGDATDAVSGFGTAGKAADDFEKRVDRLQDGVKVAGAAAGLALAAGFYGAVENQASNNKLAAQLGADPAEAARLGGIAGDLYADAYGDSLDTVNQAILGVQGNIAGMADATEADMERVTGKVLSLTTAFDLDLGQTTTAVGQLIRTGMAQDADEALDIITAGLQDNARAADDLLDTFTEYPAVLERLGMDGRTATGLISQGLAAGARNTDVIADALKEFQIRATDGSTLSAAGFEALGMNAEASTAQIARGGADAAAGLDDVLDRLRGMTDPVAQNAAAVALFGTKAEDLGNALFALDPSTAVDGLGDVTDAAARLDETMGKGQGLAQLQREVEQTFTSIGEAAMPVLMPLLDGLKQFAPILGPAAIAVAGIAAGFTVFSGVMKAYAAVQALQTSAQWANNAAWLASPTTWIILAIVAAIALVIAIVVLLIQHWDDVAATAEKVWSGVIDWIGQVGDWFGTIFAAIGDWWDGLVRSWNDGIDGFIGMIRDALNWLGKLVDNAVPGWVKDLLGMESQTFAARMIVEEPTARASRLAFTADETMAGFAQPLAIAATTAGLAAPGTGSFSSNAPRPGDTYYVDVHFSGIVTDEEAVADKIRGVLSNSDKTRGRALAGRPGA